MGSKYFKQINAVALIVFFIAATSCSKDNSTTHPTNGPEEPTFSNSTDNPDDEETNNTEEEESHRGQSEEELFVLVTKTFEAYLPRGLYKGATEVGEPCQIVVKPFKNAGKDLIIEVESSHADPNRANKVSITLAPGQNITIIGAPKQNPPVMRMWIEVVVPYFRPGRANAIKLLSVKFDPATKKTQKRKSIGNLWL